MRDRGLRVPLVAVLMVLGLVAAACGDGGSSSGDGGDGGGGNGGGGSEDATDITTEAGDPQPGGKVVFGLEAETSGFDPVNDRWAVSAYQVASAIFDPLVALNDEGEYVPYLAESVEPNEESTEWTVTLREGVKFHDGSDLVAADVIYLYEQHIASPLTKPVFAPVEAIVPVDGDPLSLRFELSSPWVTFPVALAAQTGVVPTKATIDDPEGGLNPVGTGPFKMVSYEPDSAFVAEKWDEYWQEGLPYLDEIEFRPIPDVNSRGAALDSGDIQIFSTDNFEVAADYREKCATGECQIITDTGESEEVLVMLNTATAPFDNENARKALAYATDQESLITTLQAGATPAKGPWAPNSQWYDPVVEEAFPSYDPAEAEKYVAAYEEETGEPLSFAIGSTPTPTVKEAVDLLVNQWAEVGIEAEVKVSEQTTYILEAVNGSFQANIWRQFGETNPDGAYIWWHSDNATEPGTIGLNMARNEDPEIDEAMRSARENEDFDFRKEQYGIVAERFAADLPYIWIYHTNWSIIAAPEVHGLTNGILPNGDQSLPFQGGVARVTYLWVDQ